MALLPSLNQFQNNVTNSLVALDNNFSAIATALNTTLAGSGGAADVGSISGTVQGDITTLQANVTTLQSTSGAGFRNRIINGSMRTDQRNKGASQTITAAAVDAYTVDRFYAYCTGANVTGQRVAGTGADQYAYQFTGAASVTGIFIGQRIEATNIWDLASTTVTVSATLANSLLTTVTWAVYYANASDTWPTNNTGRTQISTGNFTVTSTPTKFSAQVALPANAVNGISIEFSVGAQISGTFSVTEVQIEPGSTFTSFERVPVAIENALCQRYYTRKTLNNPSASFGMGQFNTATTFRSHTDFPVSFRSAPTLSTDTASNFCAQHGGTNSAISAIALVGYTDTSVHLESTVAGQTAGNCAMLTALSGTPWIAISAEL